MSMALTPNLESDQQQALSDSQSQILNHRKSATFLAKAARLHLEAARQHLEGNPKKVSECVQGAQDLLLKVKALQQDGIRRMELN